MKLGIKKIHENEWQVHIACATIRMDRFSLELLNIALERLEALDTGQTHSVLKSYIHLAERLLELNASDLQALLRVIANEDVLQLLLIADNQVLTQTILTNTGGILAKQLEADLQKTPMPSHAQAKVAIRRIIEKMFQLEGDGTIRFVQENQRYI